MKENTLQVSEAELQQLDDQLLPTILIIARSLFKQKCQTSAHSSFFDDRTCCFCLSFLTVNTESLGFGLLVGEKKQFKDVTLASGKS